MKCCVSIAAVVWIYLATISLAAASLPSPTENLRGASDQILLVLKDDKRSLEEKRESIRHMIDERFDFKTMSKQILGKNWSRADVQQKDRFVRLFSRMLQNTYLILVEQYKDESVSYQKEIRKEKFASVDALIHSDTRKIAVVYKFILGGRGWSVYDVVIEGVSMVANYRTSFAAIIRQKGMDGLLAELEAKVHEPNKAVSASPVANGPPAN